MTKISETISGLDFFYCEKSSCRLKTEICLKRQEVNRTAAASAGRVKFDICTECSQGARIKELIDSAGPVKPRKPSAGEGKKNVECPFYSSCLDYVTKECWKSFNCESRGLFQLGSKEINKASKMEKKKICKKCNDKPTIHPNSPYCSGCLQGMKQAKQKTPQTSKTKKPGSCKAKPEKALKTASTAATIDFGKYVSVLREIEKLAEEEMRPLGLQVVYMLSKQLKMRSSHEE